MIKLNSYIIKFFSYLVLIGYITIISINVLHHHTIDLGKYPSTVTSADINPKSDLYFNGSEIFCRVQMAYSSINNLVTLYPDPFQVYEKHSESININYTLSKLTKEKIFHYSLRAPPIKSA
jgi:hypothetical protein